MAKQIIVLTAEEADAMRAETAANVDFRLDPADAGDGVFVLSIECASDPAFTDLKPAFDSALKTTFDETATKSLYADVKAEVAAIAAEAVLEAKPVEAKR
jgi:hypothetical protein